jgi:UrcA family protein
LSNEEGARVLYGRISNAARKACGPSFAVWYPTVSRLWKDCYQATVEHAIKTVNQPMLTALYERSMKVAAR